MIKTEFYRTRGDGVSLYRTYSDADKYVKQIETGIEYAEAIDVADTNGKIGYTYEETDRDIENIEDDIYELEQKAKAYDILIGEE